MNMYTAEEVAEIFQINPSRFKRLVKSHGWPSHKLGNSLRFTDEDVAQIEKLTRVAPVVVEVGAFGRPMRRGR